MGVLIKCNDADFTNYIGIADYPIFPSLKNLYYFGGTQAESIKDHSGNNNDGIVVGNITVNTHSITFSDTGTANKITAQKPTVGINKITAIAMFKKTGLRGLVSNGPTNLGGGFCLGTGRSIYSAGSAKSINYEQLPDANGYYILGLVIGEDGGTVYRSVSEASIAELGYNDSAYITANQNYPITFGATGYHWAMDGSADIAVAAYYEDALTQDQLKNTFSFLRLYAEKNGLTLA